jgi:hypothetical protein
MMAQEENISAGDKEEWIRNQLRYNRVTNGKKPDENPNKDSDEWYNLENEFDVLYEQEHNYPYGFEDDELESEYSNIDFIAPKYNKDDFKGMRESGVVVSTKDYTVAHYEFYQLRLISIAEKIKSLIDEHFILYDYKGNIRSNNQQVLKLLNGMYDGNVEVEGDLLIIEDTPSVNIKIAEINNNIVYSEKEATDFIVNHLVDIGIPSNNLILDKKLYDTNKRLDISILLNEQIIAIIDIKKINKYQVINDDKRGVSSEIANQLNLYYDVISSNQEIVPKIFIVFYADSMHTFYEYDINSQNIIKQESFPDYNSLINPTNTTKQYKYKENNNTYASYHCDVPHKDDNDTLEITKDVKAFAKLIAYKDLPTPLSIGLFGKWGSGKSFFMEKLSKQIDYYSSHSDKNTFCKDVVHVRFNAWHYSDTSLWASLVSKIFNEIDKKINNVKDEDVSKQHKNLLYKELKSSKIAIEEKMQLSKELKHKYNLYNDEITVKKEQFQNTKDELKLLEVLDYGKLIINEPEIKSEIVNIKNALNIDKELDLQSIKDTYYELTTFRGTITKAINLILYDNKFRKLLLFIGLPILVFTIAFIYLPDGWKLTSFTAILGVIAPILNQIKKLRPIVDTLSTVMNNWEKIKNKKREEHYNEINRKKELQDAIQNELNVINLQLENIKEIEIEIEKEIEDIENGKYFKKFILERVSSTDYTQHLGLISLIRDDFTQLEKFLLSEQNNKEYNVDRIVLYIDDLDRCSDELVINVLEAIHLLLAFKLFVVVVGVDLRWIQNSLINKHKNFTNDLINITPKQYIEKLFQIPFKIKDLTEDDKQNFVRNILKDNIINIEEDKSSSNIKELQNINKVVYENQNYQEVAESDEQNINELIDGIEEKTSNIHKELQLLEEEIKYIEALSKYIGDTPRTLKRFINTYRIIRSHEDINNILEESFKNYKIILLLLSETFWNEHNDKKLGKEFKEELESELQKDYKILDESKKLELECFIKRFSFDM